MTKGKKGKPPPESIRRMFPNVTRIVDANKSVEVSVTPDDCLLALKMDPRNCAMALAAKRELKADAVVVGLSTSYLIHGTEAIRYKTPESVAREIVSFDRHSDFDPGNYYLRPYPPAQRLGVPHRRHGHKGGKKKSATRVVHHVARVRTSIK